MMILIAWAVYKISIDKNKSRSTTWTCFSALKSTKEALKILAAVIYMIFWALVCCGAANKSLSDA